MKQRQGSRPVTDSMTKKDRAFLQEILGSSWTVGLIPSSAGKGLTVTKVGAAFYTINRYLGAYFIARPGRPVNYEEGRNHCDSLSEVARIILRDHLSEK